MKTYLAHKFYSDGRNRKLIEDISESLKENGIETVKSLILKISLLFKYE